MGFLRWAAALLGCILAVASASAEIRIRDVEGRDVVLPGPAKRVLLGDGHTLVALSLIHPDPASLVVASQGDLKRHSPDIWERFRQASPAADRIAIVGEAAPDTFSIEAALAAAPDLAIFGGIYGPSVRSTEVVARLEAAGVPVLFVDFFTAPLEKTADSMRVLGAALGRKDAAKAFTDFYAERRRRIAERLASLPEGRRPLVFLQAFGGVWDCCWVPGSAGLGEFVRAAGGRNLGDELFPGRSWGQAGLEYVLGADPAVYVTTGNPHVLRSGGLALGTGVSAETAAASFRTVLKRGVAADLSAVTTGRAFGLWHLLHGLPLNIVALEALARWCHPELFGDVDPAATMAEIGRFLSVPLPGTFVVGPP